MSTRMMSFMIPPAASIRCLILVKVCFAWSYIEPSPRTPPLPSPAVMPAMKTWLPWTRQFDHVPGAGSWRCGLLTRFMFMIRISLVVRRPAVHQAQPAARDAVDEPDAERRDGQRDGEQAEAERGEDEGRAQREPEHAEPERTDLPAEVRLEPRPAHVAAVDVVEDHRDDRRPADEEGAHHGGRADDAGDEAGRVQRVDDVGQPPQERARLGRRPRRADAQAAPPRAFRNARSKPGSARTTVSRSTVSEMRMCPGMPKPEPGTVSTPSSARRRTKATSSAIGVRGK